MNTNEIVFILVWFAVTYSGLHFAYWYSCKTKSKVAICKRCKYFVKTGWWQARIKRTGCRTPSDPTRMSFVTGKIMYPVSSCEVRNKRGTCPDYKKVWWRNG